jgi:hypothetical protein
MSEVTSTRMARYEYVRVLSICAQVRSAILMTLLIATLTPCILYFFPHGGRYEQAWLNAAISHLRVMRPHCDDPDLQGVLDYTIQRYNRIGPFDVSVQWTVNFLPTGRALAYNAPWLPGITLDHDLLHFYPVELGAVILCHEALHDYYPYIGHSHITHRERKLHELSRRVSQ